MEKERKVKEVDRFLKREYPFLETYVYEISNRIDGTYHKIKFNLAGDLKKDHFENILEMIEHTGLIPFDYDRFFDWDEDRAYYPYICMK